jgi:hypothetical protein
MPSRHTKCNSWSQADFVANLHANDFERGAGWVYLPDALANKYPNAPREIAWQLPNRAGQLPSTSGD